MVKPRSGLGRGLSSLMNGSNGEGFVPDKTGPIGRVITEKEPKPIEEEPAQPIEEAPAVETAPEAVAAPPVPAEPQPVVPVVPQPVEPAAPIAEPAEEEHDLYVSAEDNVTIKSVVERVVSKEPESAKVVGNTQSGQFDRATDEVDINLIEANPDQPRTNFKKEELEELAESIKKNGLLQPILVRPIGDGRYQIVAGERRWQACKLLGLAKVPVRVREVDDDKTIMLALVENIQRSDLNPIEEAYGYRRMMERGGMTQAEVAQAVSKGRSTIANALRLLELPEDAQQLLFEEKITAGHARAILSIPDKEGRRKLTDKLIDESLSVRETEAIARLLSGKHDGAKEPKPPAPKSYKTVARSLSETLSAPVKVRSSNGKNRIEIEFKDEVDLERLFRLIMSE